MTFVTIGYAFGVERSHTPFGQFTVMGRENRVSDLANFPDDCENWVSDWVNFLGDRENRGYDPVNLPDGYE